METTNDNNVTLYSYWRSSCSWRVRIALAWKGISYEYKAVHLVKGEQMNEEYAAKNPMREVPTLVIDGHVLNQSVAILEYLEETRPEPPLLPNISYPDRRAAVRKIVNLIAADIQPIQTLRVLNRIGEEGEEKVEWAQHWINFGFRGKYFVLVFFYCFIN